MPCPDGVARQSGARSRRAKELWRGTPWRAFAGVLRDERCTAILAQEYEYARFDALAALSLRLRLPLYATFQGGDRTLSPIEARVRRWSLRRCRGLAVASARERERLTADYIGLALRIAPIANPIDCNEWQAVPREQARAALGIDNHTLLVLNHGRIDIQRKGLDVLLDAWRLFSARRADARLQLIGSGQDHEAFERLLAQAALPGVAWHAAYLTDRGELRRWLSAADAYVDHLAHRRHAGGAARSDGVRSAGGEQPCAGAAGHLRAGRGLGRHRRAVRRRAGHCLALERLADSAELRSQLGAAARRSVETRFSVEAVGRRLRRLHRPRFGMIGRSTPCTRRVSLRSCRRLRTRDRQRRLPRAAAAHRQPPAGR